MLVGIMAAEHSRCPARPAVRPTGTRCV